MAAQSFADPYVELRFTPEDVKDLALTGKFLGHPQEALESAFIGLRMMMVARMKEELPNLPVVDAFSLLRVADLAWQMFLPRYRKLSAPLLGEVYLRAYQQAEIGDVPTSVIFALADEHAERLGAYYHQTSREAMVAGFNTFVNRRVATAKAADQVLSAYGLTPRQMSGYTSLVLKTEEASVKSPMNQGLKARFLRYIGQSVQQRVKALVGQEIHNAEQQSNQIAWTWLQEHGQLSEQAQKVWLTERDEKVCPLCGPLHGKKVMLGEQFVVKDVRAWVPGLHPNCRCRVRLVENRFSFIKSLEGRERFDFNQKHPRGHDGQFARKATKVKEKDTTQFQALLDTMFKEPVAETPKGTLTPLDVSVAKPMKVASRPLVVNPVPLDVRPAALNLTAASQRLDAAIKKPLQFTAAQRLAMKNDTAQLFVQRSQALRPEKKLRLRGTVKLEHPVYSIVEPEEIYEDEIEITHDDRFFTSDPYEAAAMAEDLFEQNIDDEVDRLLVDNQNKELYEAKHWVEGETGPVTYQAYLTDPSDIRGIVSWAAYQNRLEDGDHSGDGWATLIWHRDGENESPQSLRYSELAGMLGIDPDQFNVGVMELSEAHMSEETGLTEVNPGSRYGEYRVSTQGRYRLVWDSEEGFGRSASVEMYRLEPVDPIERDI